MHGGGEGTVVDGSLSYGTRRALYRAGLLAFVGAHDRLCLLTQMPGNTGDHLIWAGTTDLLDSGGLHYARFSLCDLGKGGHRQDTLVVPGSGACTRHWHEWLPDAVIRASAEFARVLVLPSSFDVDVPVVAACLSRPNVFAFAREPVSYRAVKRLGRVALSFDPALYATALDVAASAAMCPGGERLLLALREDKDSLLPESGLRPAPGLNDDISATRDDLYEWILAIAQADAVITDRLHVAVAAVLLRRRLTYLDPFDLKISTYFAYVFRDAFGDAVQRCSIDWLRERDFVVENGAAA